MWDVFLQYNGDSLYLAAFAAGLVYWIYKGRKRTDGIVKKAAFAAVLSAVLVFNEAAYQAAGKLTNPATYYRFFWMLPVTFFIAYLVTELLDAGRKKQTAAVLLLAACLAFGANLFFLNRENLNRPHNIYGLSPDTITVSDEIMADWKEEGHEAESRPTAAFDMYLEYQVRAYEPRILWGISRKAYLYQAEHGYDYKKYVRQQHLIAAVNEGIKNDSRTLRRCLDKEGIDYLVIRSAFDMDSYLSEISVLPESYSENYTIYKVIKDPDKKKGYVKDA